MAKENLKELVLEQTTAFLVVGSMMFAVVAIKDKIAGIAHAFGLNPETSLIWLIGPLVSFLIYRAIESTVKWQKAEASAKAD